NPCGKVPSSFHSRLISIFRPNLVSKLKFLPPRTVETSFLFLSSVLEVRILRSNGLSTWLIPLNKSQIIGRSYRSHGAESQERYNSITHRNISLEHWISRLNKYKKM